VRWRQSGVIDGVQHDAIAALVRKERFSVYSELAALLYLGVVSCVAGIGWTVYAHFNQLGDTAIVAALTAAFAGAVGYCFAHGLPYSNGAQEPPRFAFDYLLYFSCLIFGVELGFIEYRFNLLKDRWDHYLVLSSVLYFALAYRFDNRFVLSLALSTLAGWFGLRLLHAGWLLASLRLPALAYAALVAASGTALFRARIKPHFFETYLHVATNAALITLATGVIGRDESWWYSVGLALVGGTAITLGLKFRSFAFVLYGIAYAYISFSILLQQRIVLSFQQILAYDVASATGVVILLVVLARKFGREA
jgi:hypothetical protein